MTPRNRQEPQPKSRARTARSRPRGRANGEGSIYPYRNGYAAYAWVTTPSGDQARKYVYGKTREVVHERWLKLQTKAATASVPTSIPTLEQYLTRWLSEVVQPNLELTTHAYYETMVRLYICPTLGGRRLDRLGTRDVQAWVNKLGTICQCCAQGKDASRPKAKQRCCAIGHCCQEYAGRRTVQAARNTLRAALNHAKDSDELVSRNAANYIKVPTPARRRRRDSVWSVEEASRFLASAHDDNDPLYAAYVLVLVNALRKGEVLGLTWASIDFDESELDIRWQLQRSASSSFTRNGSRPRTPTPTTPCRCRASAPQPSSSAAATRRPRAKRRATGGSRVIWSSPPAGELRSSRATSIAASRPAAGRLPSPGSGCTTPGIPAPRSWPSWRSTPGSRCASCGTPRSRSRWRSTPTSPTRSPVPHSTGSATPLAARRPPLPT